MNTENKTLYIQIPCSEELPPINEPVTVYSHEYTGSKSYPVHAYWDGNFWNDIEFNNIYSYNENAEIHEKVDYWLKPVSESKFASDFAEWCSVNNWIYDKDFKCWHQKWNGLIKKTTSELQKEFLKTYKG
jgi:hypothetical protein